MALILLNKSERYDSLIQFYSKKYDLDFKLIKKQLIAESSLNPYAMSPVGASGLGQFMQPTWKEWGYGHRSNPEESIKACCKYMTYLISRFGEITNKEEKYKMALASYNAGIGNINKMLAEARKSQGLPYSYNQWAKQGSKGGAWQTWEYASRFLSIVTGEKSDETIGYIKKIMEG